MPPAPIVDTFNTYFSNGYTLTCWVGINHYRRLFIVKTTNEQAWPKKITIPKNQPQQYP